jgi:hypothetical protein
MLISEQDWSFYFEYGKESFDRLADESAKRRVGMSFCLNVLRMDISAFSVSSSVLERRTRAEDLQAHPQVFTLILALGLVTHQVTIEHEYASALLHAPASRQWFLLLNFPLGDWTRDEFMAERRGLIDSALCAWDADKR